MGMTMLKVLIADDDAVSRSLVVEALKVVGCQIIEAETGRQTIELAQKEKPDLVLMDHLMPEMNGYEAMKEIRKAPGLENVPFVMITGNYDIQILQEKEKLTRCAFLPKPYTVEQLMATIEIALEKPFP